MPDTSDSARHLVAAIDGVSVRAQRPVAREPRKMCSVCGLQPARSNGRCNPCRTYWIKHGTEAPPRIIERRIDRRVAQQNNPQPEPTTLYRYFDTTGRLLYVGITGQGRRRASQHAANAAWWADVSTASFEHFGSRSQACAAERRAIKDEHPIHNVSNGEKPWTWR